MALDLGEVRRVELITGEAAGRGKCALSEHGFLKMSK